MADIKDMINNPSAERGIISLILKNVDSLIECSSSNLYSEHFAIKTNQVLYSVLCYLAEQGVKHFDSNTIYSTIQDKEALDELDEFGGREYIDMLIQTPTVDNLKIYIKIVKECATRRTVYYLGDDLKKEVVNTKSTEELLQNAQTKILNTMLDNGGTDDTVKLGSSSMERLLKRAEEPSDVFGYKIGWEQFDAITQGFAGNDLVVMVGASKTGKSTWLVNVAKNYSIPTSQELENGDTKLCGLYIDTEMKTEEQEDRLIAMTAEVPLEEIRNGFWAYDTDFGTGESKKKRVEDAIKRISASNLYHIYMPDFNINKVSAKIREYKIKYDIDYCIFDYIKLPNGEVGTLKSAQEFQLLGYFVTCLKDMAGICDIPIVTACQSNRNDLNSTDPDASDIGGSYRILQLATKLMFIRNKTPQELTMENHEKGNQKIHVKYQRNGEGDKAIDVQFDRPILRMREVGV